MKKIIFQLTIFFILMIFLFQQLSFAQHTNSEEDRLKTVALEMMNHSSTCALITLDKNNAPVARMMQTTPTANDFIIWLATNPKTRKVEQITVNEKVSLYYSDSTETGYLSVQGKAILVNDLETKKAHWKEGWQAFYPNMETDMVLIKIIPTEIELVSYVNGIISKEETWAASKLKLTN